MSTFIKYETNDLVHQLEPGSVGGGGDGEAGDHLHAEVGAVHHVRAPLVVGSGQVGVSAWPRTITRVTVLITDAAGVVF